MTDRKLGAPGKSEVAPLEGSKRGALSSSTKRIPGPEKTEPDQALR